MPDFEARDMGATKTRDEQVRTQRAACAFLGLPKAAAVLAALAVALMLAWAIAFADGSSAGFSGVEEAWADTAYAAEEVDQADQIDGEAIPEPDADAADDPASEAGAKAAGADSEEEEPAVEEIEDDEVPMAEAINTDRNIKYVIIAGVVAVVALFVFFMRRTNRSMDSMRRRFR